MLKKRGRVVGECYRARSQNLPLGSLGLVRQTRVEPPASQLGSIKSSAHPEAQLPSTRRDRETTVQGLGEKLHAHGFCYSAWWVAQAFKGVLSFRGCNGCSLDSGAPSLLVLWRQSPRCTSLGSWASLYQRHLFYPRVRAAHPFFDSCGSCWGGDRRFGFTEAFV